MFPSRVVSTFFDGTRQLGRGRVAVRYKLPGLAGLLMVMVLFAAPPALAKSEECSITQSVDGLVKKCDVYYVERVPQRVCKNHKRYDTRRKKMVNRRLCRTVYSENRRWVRSYTLPLAPGY